MRKIMLCSILFSLFGFISIAQTPCPDVAAITANDKCVFLSWEMPPMPLPSPITVDGSTYTYQSGDGTVGSVAIYRDATPGGGACNANQANLFTGSITIDGDLCVFDNGILGVEWLSFDVLPRRTGVEISWKVIEDEFNKQFEIERSNDLFQWEKIATVSTRSSYHLDRYVYEDESVSYGRHHYRIKQVDFSGKFDYSPVRSIELWGENEISIRQIATTSKVSISGISKLKDLNVVVSNLNGQNLFETTLKPEMNIQMDLESEHLIPGLYFITVYGNGIRVTEKMVIP